MPTVDGDTSLDITAQVSSRIREERRRRGWTLDELARRSGLSKSYLSRIEDRDRQPSIAALLSIAKGFNIGMASLFDGAGSQPVCQIIRRDASPVIQGNGLAYQLMTASDIPAAMQPIRISVPSERKGDELYRHDGEEWIYVLSGTLGLTLGPELHELAPGDAAYFDAGIPHRLNALNGRDVEAILVACASPRTLLGSYL